MESQPRPERLRRAVSHPPYGRSKLGVPQVPTLALFFHNATDARVDPGRKCVCVDVGME